MAAVDLTDAALDAVALRVANKLIAGGGVLETTDVANVAAATTAKLTATGGVLDSILKQAQANGSGISSVSGKLDAVKAVLDSIDFDALPAEIAVKLNGLSFVLQEGGA